MKRQHRAAAVGLVRPVLSTPFVRSSVRPSACLSNSSLGEDEDGGPAKRQSRQVRVQGARGGRRRHVTLCGILAPPDKYASIDSRCHGSFYTEGVHESLLMMMMMMPYQLDNNKLQHGCADGDADVGDNEQQGTMRSMYKVNESGHAREKNFRTSVLTHSANIT